MPSASKTLIALFGLLAVLYLANIAESASISGKMHSIAKRESTPSVCRSNAVCGWEVYDTHTRNLEYYVSSSCKCSAEESCLRVDDDISISAYVYRCRPRRNKNRNKTTSRPQSGNSTS